MCFLLKQLSSWQPSASAHRLELAMTRQDIADYLGLTIETVSRAFGKLKREGIINIHSAHTVENPRPRNHERVGAGRLTGPPGPGSTTENPLPPCASGLTRRDGVIRNHPVPPSADQRILPSGLSRPNIGASNST